MLEIIVIVLCITINIICFTKFKNVFTYEVEETIYIDDFGNEHVIARKIED